MEDLSKISIKGFAVAAQQSNGQCATARESKLLTFKSHAAVHNTQKKQIFLQLSTQNRWPGVDRKEG